MNIVVLVWHYLKARPLNTVINIILLSLGIAVITLLLLLNRQLEQKITQNSKGIDLVVGAKGSPLQLILSSIFHIDFPTGNISLRDAEQITRSRFVKKAIPLSLGDSYKTFRIVGTTRDYPELYNGSIATGKWFEQDLEVTIGSNVAANTGLKVGDKFASAHGLAEGGHLHDEHDFVVAGILSPSYSVLDNLILTNVESVWVMHDLGPAKHEESHDHEEGEDHEHHHHNEKVAIPDSLRSPIVPSIIAGDSTLEITTLLLQYRSPMAAVQLPRNINAQTKLQAASPAFESARLFSILGAGVEVLMAFGYVLIIISGLSIFIALYNSLKERRYDLAIMRSMGASRSKIFFSILLEGGMLTLFGTFLGLLLGHGAVLVLSNVIPSFGNAGISWLVFYSEEWIILVGTLFLGLISSALPAIQAYRTDISKVLAGN